VEVAYWIKAIVGHDQHLDVKSLPQVTTIKPYDYVIMGSCSRLEKPHRKIYEFVEKNEDELAKKEVCYYLTTSDYDETLILKPPGSAPRLVAGRNYLIDILKEFPTIKPVVIGGFGGRQVLPTLNVLDSLQTWLWRKIANEAGAWEGLDIVETLVMERVEAFANEIRTKILNLPPRENVEELRGYWTSLQPASLTDPKRKKFEGIAYDDHHSTEKLFYTRYRIKGDLGDGVSLLQTWANRTGIELKEQVKTSYNSYYHAVKDYDGEPMTTHVVAATLPEDPGYVHFSFRCFKKSDKRMGVEEDIRLAEEILRGYRKKVE
jgi:menaquinone-dependent protoporphyrinogen IX oxidase